MKKIVHALTVLLLSSLIATPLLSNKECEKELNKEYQKLYKEELDFQKKKFEEAKKKADEAKKKADEEKKKVDEEQKKLDEAKELGTDKNSHDVKWTDNDKENDLDTNVDAEEEVFFGSFMQ